MRRNNREQQINNIISDLTKNRLPLFDTISIETFSKCNGGCSFCPVNRFDDPRPDNLMDEELFKKIILNLYDLEYNGQLILSLNNEPFLDKRIYSFIKLARKKLPNCFLELKKIINSFFDENGFKGSYYSDSYLIGTPSIGNIDDDPENIVNQVIESPYTRVPIWKDNNENIIGLIHAKNLLKSTIPLLSAQDEGNDCNCNTALENAIITAPDARDPEMLQKLKYIAGRVLK